MLASSIIGGIGALGSAIYGAFKSSKANNQARKLIQQQRDDNKRWYDVKMSQDYTQRADVQAAIKKQRELLDEQYKRARATNAVAGGTDEALALQKQAANNAVADTMTNVASNAAAYKDNVEQQYRANDAALNQQQAQSYQQQAAQTAAAASQAVNAGLNLVGQGLAERGNQIVVNEPQQEVDLKQVAAEVNRPGTFNPLNGKFNEAAPAVATPVIPAPAAAIMDDQQLKAAREDATKAKKSNN